jgi:hypothetical protein
MRSGNSYFTPRGEQRYLAFRCAGIRLEENFVHVYLNKNVNKTVAVFIFSTGVKLTFLKIIGLKINLSFTPELVSRWLMIWGAE